MYLSGITQVLGEDMADSLSLSHPLPQVRQFTSLCLDQIVVLPEGRETIAERYKEPQY